MLVKVTIVPAVGIVGVNVKLATGGMLASGRISARVAECVRLPLVPVTVTL